MKHKKLLAALISLFAMLFMIANPEEIIHCAKNALILCASSLIPSIFPFMVAASLFINYSDKNSFNIFAPLMKFLFGTSPISCAALLPGMLCGYPVGASCTAELYKNNMISKSEAESLIAFSNNSGPLFIIGTIGIGFLGSARYGTILYIIHIFSAILCGLFLKPFTKPFKNTMQLRIETSSKDFTDCICDSTMTILKICGFVVVFAIINRLILPLASLLPKHLKCILSSFLELTNASNEITNQIQDKKMCLVFLSGALGWSGMSVHMQVKSIIKPLGLSMKKYYAIRALSSIISIIITYMFFYYKISHMFNFIILNRIILITSILLLFLLSVRLVQSILIFKRKKS